MRSTTALVASAVVFISGTALPSLASDGISSKGGPSVYYGKASWYGERFHGRRTASGEIFNMYGLTAAHKTLPFDTMVRVTNLMNHRQVIVRINDRGPYVKNRDLDLSYAAAREIDMLRTGVIPVRLEVIPLHDEEPKPGA